MRHNVDVQVIARVCQAGEQRAEDGAVDEELGDGRIGEAGCYHGGKKREEQGKGEGVGSVSINRLVVVSWRFGGGGWVGWSEVRKCHSWVWRFGHVHRCLQVQLFFLAVTVPAFLFLGLFESHYHPHETGLSII
jgi:hypothetical protein